MLAAGVFLLILGVLPVHGDDLNMDPSYVYYEDEVTDSPDVALDDNDWLYKLLDESNVCDPNPCFNGGSCQNASDTEYQCHCTEPYIGTKCQRVRNICANVTCGHGDCVINLNKAPFFECSCRPPYQGPNCNTLPASPCEPNPCQNGGVCNQGERRYHCTCPEGFTGRFCGTAPTDCYSGNGETYNGVVSTTEDGVECLDWFSNFILLNIGRPLSTFPEFEDLERNNHCRNPDGDGQPWCFIKKNGTLQWEYCNVKTCPEGTVTPPTIEQNASAQFSQCGIPGVITKIFKKIEVKPGYIPWMVSVQQRALNSTRPFTYVCGGTLIGSCWVLTAAHCIEDVEYQVMMGGVNKDRAEETEQVIPVIQTIKHEDYRLEPDAIYNDIALLQLKVMDSPYCAKETRFVRTACLPDQRFPTGHECMISGWGETASGPISPKLRHGRVLLISDKKCTKPEVHGDLLDDSMMCAGNPDGVVDSCQGDSGGPMACKQNYTHYVTGVVSWGDGCGVKNKPGVYTNVNKFVDWIKSKID
ncbi:hyaluronan-binding protein 2-like [Hippoglossus hippoglossus]|uniref:hyaluronan-binding protein 2-like n=1 Tax=Hippoglossus hippoglossus TaxID=8267 RepID=UPI00148C2150|nr:hyaluronan-binding protein 2-like [Hippoglossus hippoglossus]